MKMEPGNLSILRTLLLLIQLPLVSAAPCPRPCSCPQPAELRCTFRSLTSIPAAVPKHTERINLGFNSINKITEKSLVGLRKLELLMVHGNNIYSLPDGAFRDLTSLQMLMLSYNKLKEISRNTFQGLWSLARLHLDHNHLDFIHPDAFQGLTSLRLLQLEGNRLQQLHPATFTTFTVMGQFHISTLRHLHLSDNGLMSLPSRLVETMPQLENLFLHGNPWICDCSMKWLHSWEKTSPGVLKCKKDRNLPKGQLCPVCSSPRNLQATDLHAAEDLICSGPLINSPQRTSLQEDQSEVLTTEDFKEPIGSVSLSLSDEHGNQVDLECSVSEPRELTNISWEQINPLQLVSNITFLVDLECPVDRERYEQLWRLIAYYSSVPAHLERGFIISKDPHPTYVYRQSSVKDALYYTGVKVNMMAQPEWLMQTSVDLQLNRPQSSARTVKLILGMDVSKTLETELVRRQSRTWVTIESTNTTRKVFTVMLGRPSQMDCKVQSSERPVIQWMLPDGSKLDAPYSSSDNRVSVSGDGRLVIKAVSHKDTGVYYCMARVNGDFSVLHFHLNVQESSSPLPGEETQVTSIEKLAGNPVSIDCTASGSPDADVGWILPSNNIVSFHHNSSRVFVYSNGTLNIPQTQLLDSGYYKCIAMNQFGVDTLATKMTVLRRKGLMQPLQKFPTRPQSASGVNTQIKILPAETEEASGDMEVSQDGAPTRRLVGVRRRIPGKGGVHPSRNVWRRPPVLQKPPGSHTENRRRINMSKNKIDPEKWADILAKIRDKNTGTVTPFPVQHTTQNEATTEGSPGGLTLSEQQGYITTNTPVPHTQLKTNQHNELDQDNINDDTLSSLHTTTELEMTPSEHTTNEPSSKSSPLTTVSLHATTNSPSSSTFYLLDNQANTIATEQGVLQEEDGKYFSETTTPLQDTRLSDLQRDPLTTASPATTAVPIFTIRTEPETQLPPRLRLPSNRRRNGHRRKRPNRRKQRVNKATTPVNTALTTATASTDLKIEHLGISTVSFSSTVPFTDGQVKSSLTPSLKESTVSGHEHEVGPKTTSPPTSSYETKDSRLLMAKPLSESSSVTFPTASPGLGLQNASSLSAMGISQSTSVPEFSEMFTLTTQPWFTDGTPPWPDTATRSPTDVENNQSGRQDAVTDKSGKTLLKGTEVSVPSPSASVDSFIQEADRTMTAYTSFGLIRTPSTLTENYLQTEQTNTRTLSDVYHSFSQSENVDEKLEETSSIKTPVITSTPQPGTLSKFRIHPNKPQISSTGAEMSPTLRATTEYPRISPDQLTKFILTTAETARTSPASPDLKLPTRSPAFPDMNLDSRPMAKHPVTSIPAAATVQSNPSKKTSSTSTYQQLPGQESAPRGKPRITTKNFQMITVKAETDAQLPCEAEGLPMPFLSWTKVSTGLSIAQNTRMQRFEVHLNGTLIIRKAQIMDSGQYLCTVQNQYGADRRIVNLAVQSQHPRILQPRHRDVTVPLGGKVDLECRVEGHPPPQVTWVLPNQVHMTAASASVSSQHRVAVDNNGTLWISQASYSDRGIYKCISSSVAGADSVLVYLYVSVLPPVIQQTRHENMSLPEGGSAYIHCSATGAPPPVIRWITPDGMQLTASQLVTGRNFIVFPNGTLYIRGLGSGNSGRYECSASNNMASSRRTVILTVKKNLFSAKASIVSSSPQKTEVIYGKKLLLNCMAKGEPKPRIIWRTPSKKLVDAQYSFDPRIKVLLNGTITIHSVTDKDSGEYLCMARNKMGDDYIQLRVDVLTRPAKIEQKQQPSSQEVVYGEDLKVDCVASGLPNPEISWALPDGTMVNPVKQRDGISVGRSRRYVVFDNGTLYFNDVGMPEEGDYTCYAENQLGKDEMKVSVRVKAVTSPPQIQNKDQKTVRVFYGDTVTLQCNAKSEPEPAITWISPTMKVISPALDKYQILDDGTLVVQKVQRFDGGNYTCMARNSAGQDHKVTRLEVLVTPPVINGLTGAANVIKVRTAEDKQTLVDCVAKGIPTPRIMWILPGNVILPAPYYSNRMTVHLNGTLEIRSPKKTDSGQLACIARNEGGEVRLVVNLDVKEAVQMPQTRGPRADSFLLTVGNTMTLNCSFEGSSLPQPTWILPNGTPLHGGVRFSKFFHRLDGSLVISNPSVAEAGMYRCLGHSSGGLVEHRITLSPGIKPDITNRYISPVKIMNGETLLLHCQTTGEPLRLTWTLPSGVVLNMPQRAGRYAILPNGTLAIRQVSVYDRGPYVCRAANEYGSSLLPVSVTVIAHPPRITSGPPSVTYVKHGVAVQLNCAATGIPKVELAWETPDKTRLVASTQPRLFGNRYLHPQGSLIIQNPTHRDAGVYRCTARNAIGTDSKTTILNVF
ncbi:matrix-remodeling-associated protein 5 [Melanotaenia boesemani]|uniref:matrix-remodeling-associated protein 5 n=1 Tax=Melanotaenia boesemani TaxID=1250792 RepID=UPI001C054831|nr:matrix-remodeling-associated protein 5 [Melanotaenia boesemani]